MRWLKVLVGLVLGISMVVGLTLAFQFSRVAAQATSDRAEVIGAGLDYLKAQQQADGGIMGFNGVSDPDTTARSLLAFALAGEQPNSIVSAEGNSLLDYLSTQAISFTHDVTGTLFPGRAGELLAAVALSGSDGAEFGGTDLTGELEASLISDTGAYSTTAKQDFSSGQASDLNQAWAILGLSLAKRDVPENAIQWLVQTQGEDGSWGFGDPDTTALAVTALLASMKISPQDQPIQNAFQFFRITQLDNGGWRPSWDTDPLNADSTGWILQALVSAGEDPAGEGWTGSQGNPVDALLSLQKPDGSIGGTYANTYSTAEAIIGLSGVPLAEPQVAAPENKAGLAIFTGDGSVITACVTFTESSLTGLELLERSGLELETATNPNQGVAVCKIEAVGCAASNCFCSMPQYWTYWQGGENGWEYSALGAAQSQVMNGEINAWSWGTGDPLPLVSYPNICEGVAFVLPTAQPTNVPSTDTPQPSLAPTSAPVPVESTPTQTTITAPATAGTYIVYALVVLVFGVLIVYFIRSRRK